MKGRPIHGRSGRRLLLRRRSRSRRCAVCSMRRRERQADRAAAQQGKVKAVAFFGFAAANSFAQATWAGVKQAAEQAGVTAKFFDPNFNAQTQVSQIQDAITSGQYQAFVDPGERRQLRDPGHRSRLSRQHIAVVAEFTPIG